MTIIFLTDEQAKRLEITDAPYLTVKRYPFSPDMEFIEWSNVIMNNVLCTKRRFVKLLGKTALEILREEGK